MHFYFFLGTLSIFNSPFVFLLPPHQQYHEKWSVLGERSLQTTTAVMGSILWEEGTQLRKDANFTIRALCFASCLALWEEF